jgi:hypothetical protein
LTLKLSRDQRSRWEAAFASSRPKPASFHRWMVEAIEAAAVREDERQERIAERERLERILSPHRVAK